MWADGLYVKAGIEDRKAALLTIVCALSTGEKVLLACESGEQESKESWLKVLRVAETTWRKLNSPELLPLVASGVRFQDGLRDDGKLDRSESKFQPKAIAA